MDEKEREFLEIDNDRMPICNDPGTPKLMTIKKRISRLEDELARLEDATLVMNNNLLAVSKTLVRMGKAFEKCVCPDCADKPRCLHFIHKFKRD